MSVDFSEEGIYLSDARDLMQDGDEDEDDGDEILKTTTILLSW